MSQWDQRGSEGGDRRFLKVSYVVLEDIMKGGIKPRGIKGSFSYFKGSKDMTGEETTGTQA